MNARTLSVLQQGAAAFLVFRVMAYVYNCFHKYDWGHPLIKLFCFIMVFFLVVFLRTRTGFEQPASIFANIEVVVWTMLLVLIIAVLRPDIACLRGE